MQAHPGSLPLTPPSTSLMVEEPEEFSNYLDWQDDEQVHHLDQLILTMGRPAPMLPLNASQNYQPMPFET